MTLRASTRLPRLLAGFLALSFLITPLTQAIRQLWLWLIGVESSHWPAPATAHTVIHWIVFSLVSLFSSQAEKTAAAAAACLFDCLFHSLVLVLYVWAEENGHRDWRSGKPSSVESELHRSTFIHCREGKIGESEWVGLASSSSNTIRTRMPVRVCVSGTTTITTITEESQHTTLQHIQPLILGHWADNNLVNVELAGKSAMACVCVCATAQQMDSCSRHYEQ